MNEHIRELVAKCETLTGDSEGYFTVFDREKFAELIIKETMQVVAKNVAWNGYLDAADAVIEHFKDEE